MIDPKTLAERIMIVLNLADERHHIDDIKDIPLIGDVSYAEEIKALYRGYRNRLGFIGATHRSRAEVIEKIIRAAMESR